MKTANFPEKVRQRRLVALKNLPKKAPEGFNRKGKPHRSQEELDHEREVLIKLTTLLNENNHFGHRSKKDHSSRAKLGRNER